MSSGTAEQLASPTNPDRPVPVAADRPPKDDPRFAPGVGGFCNARTVSGAPCRQRVPSTSTNGRCNQHGGRAVRGVAHGNFRHGRYSQYMPRDIAARAESYLRSPDVLEQYQRIAVLDAMLTEVLPQAFGTDDDEAGGGGKAWVALAEKAAEMRRAAARQDSKLYTALAQELFKLIDDGRARYLARVEVREIVQDLRRLTESERKHRVESRSMVTAEELLAFASAMGDSLFRNVKDDRERAGVVNDMTQYMRSFRSKMEAAGQ